MNILGTGLNGLIGSRIVEVLSPKYVFKNLSRSRGVDITNYEELLNAFSASDAQIVFHAAAYTDVKTAEKEKDMGKQSQAWIINVEGTKNVVRACEQTTKKLIHVSTDMVIGGEDMPKGGFTEDSPPNPLNWYAQTKYEAEKIVQGSSLPFTIIRPAYPYRESFTKPDFVRFFVQLLREGKPVSVLTDRLISPTFIDDIAGCLDILIEKNQTGIFHTAGSQILSIFEAVTLIAETFGFDKSLVGRTTRGEFLIERPAEPFSSALNNDKIIRLGAKMRTFEEGLNTLKINI